MSTEGTSERESPDRARTLVVWCPDWPAVSGARQAGRPASEPAAVFRANRVQTCNTAARAEGIAVGHRRRDAQSRCPELLVLTADADRDARLFEPVAAAVESLAPGVEILRPGLIACSARGPTRYFGTESAAAERIVDAVEALDVECRVGVADSLAVSVLAARRSMLVPPGGSAAFCGRLPISELARDPAISPPERAQLVDLLIRLGMTTAADFAALPEMKVATRFGADALVAHRLARGLGERGVSRRFIPEELAVEQVCDPPLDRVDTAAFLARALAERFHARLADAGMACTRLAISARTERGNQLSRIWRCARPLTPAATADRLRWQLDGWLTLGRLLSRDATGATVDEDGQGPGAITMLRLDPVEAIGAGLVQYGLWGSDGEDDQRAGWAFARVQGLLGPESVLTPVLSGGRGPGERIVLVPWGEEKIPLRDPDAPWPGVIPAPSPSHLAGATTTGEAAIELLDASGSAVTVTGRGMLSAPPVHLEGALFDASQVEQWAGPWLLDERWWSTGGAVSGSISGAPLGRSPIAPPSAPTLPLGARLEPAGPYSLGPGDTAYHRPQRPGRLLSRQVPEDRPVPLRGAGPPSQHPAPPTAIPAGPEQDRTQGTSAVSAPAREKARLQVLTDDGTALLLLFGTGGWRVEGVYD